METAGAAPAGDLQDSWEVLPEGSAPFRRSACAGKCELSGWAESGGSSPREPQWQGPAVGQGGRWQVLWTDRRSRAGVSGNSGKPAGSSVEMGSLA